MGEHSVQSAELHEQRFDRWKSASYRLLRLFTRPASLSHRQAVSIVLGLLMLIGFADYASGIRVSLAVFYLVPILLAVAWLGRLDAVGAVLASILFRVVGDYFANGAGPLPLWSWWNSASTLIVFLFIVWIFSSLLRMHSDLEERVVESSNELLAASEHRRLLQQELLEISSRERRLMGQELHDDICQHLVGTTLAAKVLANHLIQQHNSLAQDAQGIISLIEEGTGKTRQLARGLLLSAIEPGELADKLGELADEGSRTGIICQFTKSGEVTVSDAGVAAQLYRIAQEAIRNALRHADATRVEVRLVGDSEAVCLTIEDDGHGLPEPPSPSGMGLPIMSQRAAYIGAKLAVGPIPGGGMRVDCRLPTTLA
jgi:signal transduction histidine kinase